MTARRTALRTGLGLLALVVLATACGDDTSSSTEADQRGRALLAEARRTGAASDAVSYEVTTVSSGRAEETFARRGADSAVTARYDDGGSLEVRRVADVVYVRSDLELPTAAEPPWVRLDPGADLDTWVTVLGSNLLAPDPSAVAKALTSGVDRVTDRTTTRTARVLEVEPREVRNGERPTSIRIEPSAALVRGRLAELFSDDARVARRTYSRVRWGADARPITAPEGAVSVDVVRDPQTASLPPEILRGPAALPAGWSLRAVVGLTVAQGDGTCQQVLTLYAPPAPAPVRDGYLAVYLKPTGCPTPKGPGADDFTAGAYRGWIGQGTGATIGGLTVDGVSVRFRSTLPPAELATVLASWKPLTP
jgi:hypothetical protein